ncbi:MAG: hypothetical protein WC872_04180, partial [Candidatus Absconditabacterales bacterium]
VFIFQIVNINIKKITNILIATINKQRFKAILLKQTNPNIGAMLIIQSKTFVDKNKQTINIPIQNIIEYLKKISKNLFNIFILLDFIMGLKDKEY